MSVISRVRVVEPPLQDLLQEVHASQLPTLHWTGKQLHRRLLRRLQAFEGVITTANTIRVRNRVEKRVISRKTIYLFAGVSGRVEDPCSETWREVTLL